MFKLLLDLACHVVVEQLLQIQVPVLIITKILQVFYIYSHNLKYTELNFMGGIQNGMLTFGVS